MLNQRRLRRRISVAAALLLTGCTLWAAHPTAGDKPLTFLHPQTFQLGRFHVTVPGPGATLEFTHADINGTNLEVQTLKPGESFARSWSDFQASLVAASRKILDHQQLSPNRVLLVSTLNVPASLADKVQNSPNTVTLWQNEHDTILKASFDAEPTKVAVGRTSVQQTLDHYRRSDDPGTRTAKGFFVAGGAVVGLQEGGEGIAASVAVPLSPSPQKLVFNVTTDQVDGDGSDSLLARANANKGGGITVLRHGPRTVAGMAGHEHVQFAPDPYHNGHFIFAAEFEFGGKAYSLTAPQTDIRIDGTSLPPSFTPVQILSLWDAVLASVSPN